MGGKISLQPRSIRHMVPALVSPWERQSRWKAEMKWRSKVSSVIKFLIKDKTLITSKLLKTTLNVSWTFHVHISINCTCHGDVCNSSSGAGECWWGTYPCGFVAGHQHGTRKAEPVSHALGHCTSPPADWWAHGMCIVRQSFKAVSCSVFLVWALVFQKLTACELLLPGKVE